jgi:hypothetical protein
MLFSNTRTLKMQALWRSLCIIAIMAAVASAQRCDDVTKLDVRNLAIRTALRTFAFHSGIAVSDDGYRDPPEQDPGSSQPDWIAEIEKDSIIRPAPGIVVRFLLIHDSHQTGSGWRYCATAVRCSHGKLQEVFHRDGASLSVDRLDSTAISVGLNTVPGKPVRKHWSYTWDRSVSKYVLSSMR